MERLPVLSIFLKGGSEGIDGIRRFVVRPALSSVQRSRVTKFVVLKTVASLLELYKAAVD